MAFTHLSDRQWELIEPHFRNKPHPQGGHPFGSARQALDAILWILSTGAHWRSLPEGEYGHWETAYRRFQEWTLSGAIEGALLALQVRRDQQGRIDWSTCMIDGSSIRASRAAAGARKKGGRRRSQRITRSATRAEASVPSSSS